jgi:hypothetical protein
VNRSWVLVIFGIGNGDVETNCFVLINHTCQLYITDILYLGLTIIAKHRFSRCKESTFRKQEAKQLYLLEKKGTSRFATPELGDKHVGFSITIHNSKKAILLTKAL